MSAVARAALFAALGASAAGCAHQYNLPVNRFDSPEVRGRAGPARVEFPGTQAAVSVKVDPAKPEATPTLGNAMANVLLGFALGLSEKADVGVRAAPNAPLLFRLKYQVAGEPETTAAHGNFAVALVGAAGYTRFATATSAEPGVTTDLTSSFLAFDGGVAAGYRFSRRWLIYAGGSYGMSSYSGGSARSDGGGASTAFSGSASLFGYHLGAQLEDEALVVKFELTKASASAGGASTDGYFPGLLLGLRL